MKTQTKVLLGLAALAGIALVIHEHNGVPSGYGSVLLVPGVYQAPTPANGQTAFVLPSGAAWIAATRATSTNPAPVTLQLPASNAALLAAAAVAGQLYAFTWRDSNGAVQTSGILLT